MLLTTQCKFCNDVAGVANPLVLTRSCMRCAKSRPEMINIDLLDDAMSIFKDDMGTLLADAAENPGSLAGALIKNRMATSELAQFANFGGGKMDMLQSMGQREIKVAVNTAAVPGEKMLVSLVQFREAIIAKWKRDDATERPTLFYQERFAQKTSNLQSTPGLNGFPIGFFTVCQMFGKMIMELPLSLVIEKESDDRVICPWVLINDHQSLNYGARSDWLIELQTCPTRQMQMPAGIQSQARAELHELLNSLVQLPALPATVFRTAGKGEESCGRYTQRNANFAFGTNGAELKFYFEHLDSYLEGCSNHNVSMIFQKNFEPPRKLLMVGSGEETGCVEELLEADVRRLLAELGLAHTSPAEFFAFLLSLADPWTHEGHGQLDSTSCNLVCRQACTKSESYYDDGCSLSQNDLGTVCLHCHSFEDKWTTGSEKNVQRTYTADHRGHGDGKSQAFTSFAPITTAAVAVLRGQSPPAEAEAMKADETGSAATKNSPGPRFKLDDDDAGEGGEEEEEST